MRLAHLALAAGLALATIAPARAATIGDPMAFLVQASCPGGLPPFACADPAPVMADDPLLWRKHDLPRPYGYQVADSVGDASDPHRAITLKKFRPFMPPMAYASGDGGDVYLTDGTTVWASETRDGGTPGEQYFVGEKCRGGTGWVLFRTDAPFGAWADLVARLSDRPDPNACPPLASAYTRYTLESVTYPAWWNGKPRRIMAPTVISEHYDSDSIADSRSLERFYLARGYGLLLWAAWSSDPSVTPSADLASRCPALPGDGAWNIAPAPGWQEVDCRYYANFRSASGKYSEAAYGWP